MKYLKRFESVKNEPEVGYYVIINGSSFYKNSDFFLDNIGEIIKEDKSPVYGTDTFFVVRFDNNIPHLNKKFKYVRLSEILYFSSNKKELQMKLDSKKFNL